MGFETGNQVGGVMAREVVIYSALLFALTISNQASAQTSGGLMNMFTAIMGAAVVNNARIEWSKVPTNQQHASRKNYGNRVALLAA